MFERKSGLVWSHFWIHLRNILYSKPKWMKHTLYLRTWNAQMLLALSLPYSIYLVCDCIRTKSMPFNGLFRKRFEQAQIMTYYVQWWCCAQQTQTIKKENDGTLLCYPLLCTEFCNWSFFVVVVVVFCLLPLWQSRYFVCTMCTISDSLFM